MVADEHRCRAPIRRAAVERKRHGIEDRGLARPGLTHDEEQAELVKLLEPKFGVKLKPHVKTDASLIGGVRVQVGDHVLDTSVQAQLVRMRDTLVA